MVTSAERASQPEKMSPNIFISAGEASGEHYGALVVAALKKQLAAAGQTASFFGMGGERMAAAGLECVVRSEEMAVMGLTEIVRHLPRIWREFRKPQTIHPRAPAQCRRAHRLPRNPLPAGQRAAPARRSGHLLRQPAVVGLEEEAHPAGAKVHRPDAGDLSLRGAVLSRARRPGRVCGPSAGGAALARCQPRVLRHVQLSPKGPHLDRAASRQPRQRDSGQPAHHARRRPPDGRTPTLQLHAAPRADAHPGRPPHGF